MNIKNILHKMSHLKWLFLIAQIVLIFYCLIALPDNLIPLTGIIIFISGIQLGLDSLSDLDNMSTKEIARYKNQKFAKRMSNFILYGILVLLLISILFMSLKFVFPKSHIDLYNDFFDLGLDCWALILGLLCHLKSVYDKNNFANSVIDNVDEN